MALKEKNMWRCAQCGSADIVYDLGNGKKVSYVARTIEVTSGFRLRDLEAFFANPRRIQISQDVLNVKGEF